MSLAAKEKVNIICFPELSFVKEWIAEIRKTYNKMVVICGSYYEDGFNRCPIIIDGELFIYNKIKPSPSENPVQTGSGMKSGEVIFKFVTKYGNFSVLLCIDYTFLFSEVRDVDFVLNPSYDPNILRFQDYSSLMARDFGAYTIQANASDKKEKFGHSCIIGNEYEESLKKLKDIGYIPKEDIIEYKLCEAKGEMMIIACINIKTRSPPRKITPDYKGKIRVIGEYIWQGEKWEIKDRMQQQIKREE